jgi:uncharacterized protein (DUF924 family)
MNMPEQVLKFWFVEAGPQHWWAVEPTVDELVKVRFLPLLRQAAAGELSAWRTSASGRLAEVILLDQFSRNVFRGTPQAFAQDPQALALAQEAVGRGALDALDEPGRTFLLMPYMHSESRLVHVEAEELFRRFAPPLNHEFELRHKAIVDRFGRYPHRNQILGRASTADEVLFLQQPGSSF